MWGCALPASEWRQAPWSGSAGAARKKIVYHAAPSPLERSYFPITMSPNAIASWDNNPATTLRRRRRRPH
jgi:hypothetical protein